MWPCLDCDYEAKYLRDLMLHCKQMGHKMYEMQGRKIKGTKIRLVKAV